MYHMQTAPSGGGGDHRVKPCQQARHTRSPPPLPVAPMSVAPVLIKTLIVVPPNKADTTAGGERGKERGETDGRERGR